MNLAGSAAKVASIRYTAQSLELWGGREKMLTRAFGGDTCKNMIQQKQSVRRTGRFLFLGSGRHRCLVLFEVVEQRLENIDGTKVNLDLLPYSCCFSFFAF